jgi:hypothetical protein
VDSRESEGDLRREEKRRDLRWRGGDGEGRVDKWDVEVGREEVMRSLTSCQVDQTTQPYNRRGSIEGRGQEWGRKVVGLCRHNYRSQDKGETASGGWKSTVGGGIAALMGESGMGGFLPRASYQAAPRFALPLSRGMTRANSSLEGKTLMVNGPGKGEHHCNFKIEGRSHQILVAKRRKG